MKTQTKRIGCLMLLSMALLAGCGQKGPLYLPDEKAAQQAQQK